MSKTTFQILNSNNRDYLDELSMKLTNVTGHIPVRSEAQPRGPYILFETDAMFAAVVDVMRDDPGAVFVLGPDGERWDNPSPPSSAPL
jgi:hypothetical protein